MTGPPAGWVAVGVWAAVLVVLGGTAWHRADGPTRPVVGWTLVATAFPGAWLSAWTLGPALDARLGWGPGATAAVALVLHGATLWLVSVLASAASDAWSEPAVDRLRAPAPPRPVRPTTPPAPPGGPPLRSGSKSSGLPTIRAASGGVASGASASDGGSGRVAERDGLIRVLKRGPDFQTSAAAKGLAVAWASTRDPRTLDALIDVLRRDSVMDSPRAEVWIALLKVLGDDPGWDAEQAIRADFHGSIDWDRVDALDLELHPDP